MILSSMPHKRPRRTSAEIERLKASMLAIIAAHDELTIRHLFYLMVSQSLIEKTETEYNNVVIRLALQLRRSGDIPYGKIVDGTRLYRQPRLYDSVAEALGETARLYRRDYWRNADERIECWKERAAEERKEERRKKALAAAKADVGSEYDPTESGRGVGIQLDVGSEYDPNYLRENLSELGTPPARAALREHGMVARLRS
ncbi:hypothetical protein [Mesorhizobium argentiipisi]|uniref:Uncharacterized protein n=1 Tax=Mesorhizobium argentiipisi TaxID=3015175 RepID=A0ABU8K6B9_9HYPH